MVADSELQQPRRRPVRTVLRAWLLRCPRCGQGKLFSGLFRMRSACESCQLSFEREPGFYLGAIYFNYGLTSIIATMGFMVLRFGWRMDAQQALAITVAFAVLFPILYFRHARSLWLGFDQLIDPQ